MADIKANKSAYIASQGKSNKPAYLEGHDKVYTTNVALMVDYNDQSQVYATNIALIVDYSLSSKSNKSVFTEGTLLFIRDSSPAYLDFAYLRTSKNAFLVGGLNEVYTSPVYLKGWAHPTTSKSSYIWGQPGSFQSAFLKGTSELRVSNSVVQVETLSTIKLVVTNVVLQIERRDADHQRISSLALQVEYLTSAKGHKDAYLFGFHPSAPFYWVEAYMAGVSTSSGAKSSYLVGCDQATSSKAGHVTSWKGATPSQVAAYLYGNANITDTHAALVHSGTTSRGSSAAYLDAPPRCVKNAYLEGRGIVRVTNAGITIETRPPITIRASVVGINVESLYTPLLRISNAGIVVEWEVSEETEQFGPSVWII